LTPKRLLALARAEGTAAACLEAVRAGRAGSDGDREFALAANPRALEEALARCGARFVHFASGEYPSGLENLEDPPAALFVKGSRLDGLRNAVGIVGARNPSPLGREVAASIGRGLASAGICVVSGAARGIDAVSHGGALDAGGPTIAVLGSGIDVPYPVRNQELFARIEGNGAVVSEYAPGVPAEAFRFPARNRIVAALSRAVVVVEGGERSGSLITADHALDLGLTVFAVPGPVTSPLSHAPHQLIREGATLVRGPEDVLIALGLEAEAAARVSAGLNLEEEAAFDALTGPTLPEEVARRAGIEIGAAASILLRLEMKGLVRSSGGRYERRAVGG
jgi:DNA processing protein